MSISAKIAYFKGELLTGRKTAKENQTRYLISRENANLSRAVATEVLGFVSEDRIDRIEYEKSHPYPEEILAISEGYKDPELCNYYCSTKYPIGYLDDTHFTNKAKHKEIIDKANQQKTQRLPHEAYLKHFVNDLGQSIPLWAYVDLLTISDISFLYSISEPDIKKEVTATFGLTMRKGPEILGQHIHSMTIIRSLCAHGSRIYNRLFEQKPSLNAKEKALLIVDNNNIDNAHFYGFVHMDYYGFRSDWKEKLYYFKNIRIFRTSPTSRTAAQYCGGLEPEANTSDSSYLHLPNPQPFRQLPYPPQKHLSTIPLFLPFPVCIDNF